MTQLSKRHWIGIVLALSLLCIGLTIALIVVVQSRPGESKMPNNPAPPEKLVQDCSKGDSTIDVSEPDNPGVFNDLTRKELSSLSDYLYSLTDRFTLLKPGSLFVNSSYIYGVHLYLPPKAEVLQHLDNEGPQPARQAKVVLFRGDLNPPVVEEYIVGPLPDPNSCELLSSESRKNPIPFAYRPFSNAEFEGMKIFDEIDNKIGHILQESYDAKFDNCGDKCLTVYMSSLVGTPERKCWFRAMRNVEHVTIHPIGIDFLVNFGAPDSSLFTIDQVNYAGQLYTSLDELSLRYNTTDIPKIKVPFPEVNKNLFSTMNLRGDPVPSTPQAAPRLYEPNGRRFSIKHGEVSYMQWKFQVGMHLFFGPRVYDVRFNGERIAYEVALQEISVFYSGQSPGQRYSTFLDSIVDLGTASIVLNPGADCPETAVLMDTSMLTEDSPFPLPVPAAFCVFEQNMGIPTKRHLSKQPDMYKFYSGTENSALVVRSIHNIENYDYIIDFIFHQTGALESRVASTGYISGAFNNPGEDQYGYEIHDNLIGSIHQHLFHFKVDLDIFGTSNRYETLDIFSQPVENNTDNLWEVKHRKTLHQSEMEALYNFNFEAPKYHLIYNEANKSKYGNPRAYRIHSTGLHKQLLPMGTGSEDTISWARHQMALTKVKDTERESSSIYGIADAADPVVNFTRFYSDNESLVDEDIVAWLTLGLYHIPHTEDLPVTPTVGGHLGFFLLPYNYFDECPSVQSRDAMRTDLVNQDNPFEGTIKETYGQNVTKCVPR